jgi:hypothetical protein
MWEVQDVVRFFLLGRDLLSMALGIPHPNESWGHGSSLGDHQDMVHAPFVLYAAVGWR